jgi:hypothetical protein
MSTINRLSSVDVLQPSDQIPVWDSSNGDTRKASMSTLLAFVESYFADPDYSTRIVAPAVDYFTVDIGATGDSIWMIVNPTLNFTNGAITLPPASSAVNDQEITVVFTSSVSTFVITSAGATVLGAPTQINGYDSFKVRYNASQLTWYNIGTTGSGSGSGVSQIVREDFTGDGTTTTFALSNIPSALGNELQIFIDGVYQERAGYTVSGVNIIFSEAPPVLSNIEVLGWAVSVGAETSSNLVSYTPAGTGAVLTTVQAKLRESVSVLDFGADPTGVTDSTAAIQAAIDAVAEAGTVLVPSGYYLFTSLTSASPIRLVGSGYTIDMYGANQTFGSAAWSDRTRFAGSVLISTAASGDAIYFGASSGGAAEPNKNLQIEDLLIVGPGSGTATALHTVRGKGHFLKNVGIGNFATGFNIDSCQDLTGDKLRTLGCQAGITMGGTITSNQAVLINPQIELYETFGITLAEASGVQILGGVIQDSLAAAAVGINVSANATNTVIKGVWFENGVITAAIRIYGSRTTVENCYFGNATDNLELMSTADQSNILHNYFGAVAVNAADLTVSAGATNNYIFDSAPSTNGTYTDNGTNTIYATFVGGNVNYLTGFVTETESPVVRAYLSATQNFTASVQTKVAFDSKTFDTASVFNTTTNTFTPTTAGYYQININLDVYCPAALGTAIATLYVDGAATTRIAQYKGTEPEVLFSGSCLMYLDGAQAVTLYIFVTGASPTVQASPLFYSYFDAMLIKAV